MNRDLVRLLLATFVSWTGIRLTEVALPLIALQQTGSVVSTGLVAGCAGIATITSPWWAARLRHRVTSGRALAAVVGVQAIGHLIVAVAAALGELTVVHLCLSGLVTGAAAAVAQPAERAMLADLGERMGPTVAVRALAWQDLAHRISMISSPPVAAWVVTQQGALPLMWADAIAVALAAAVVLPVGGYGRRPRSGEPAARRARDVLRAHPMVADGITMAAVGWFCWFGFALGLAILGVETERPGQLVGAGMAGYGLGSVAGSAAASLVVTRLPRMPVIITGWVVFGTTLVSLPWLAGSLPALTAASVIGGFILPLGIAALNAVIAEQTTGSDRRTAFAVQQVAANGGSSLGMLAGGGIIAVLGAATTMQVTGLILIAAPLILVARSGLSTTPRRGAVPAAETEEEEADPAGQAFRTSAPHGRGSEPSADVRTRSLPRLDQQP
jgi:MFS family permease